MVRRGALPLALLCCIAASCSADKVTESREIPFSGGSFRLIRTSVGSAMDGEKIELIFDGNGRKQVFFRGWDFSEFNTNEQDGKLAIQMCRGWIDHAEPISVGSPENLRLVRLNLNWNCSDKSHDA